MCMLRVRVFWFLLLFFHTKLILVAWRHDPLLYLQDLTSLEEVYTIWALLPPAQDHSCSGKAVRDALLDSRPSPGPAERALGPCVLTWHLAPCSLALTAQAPKAPELKWVGWRRFLASRWEPTAGGLPGTPAAAKSVLLFWDPQRTRRDPSNTSGSEGGAGCPSQLSSLLITELVQLKAVNLEKYRKRKGKNQISRQIPTFQKYSVWTMGGGSFRFLRNIEHLQEMIHCTPYFST